VKKSRFSEEQIIGLLKQHEAGAKTADLCKQQGISAATFYAWRAKYGGLEVSDAKRLRQLEEENAKLKRVVADLTLDNLALKEIAGKKARMRRGAPTSMKVATHYPVWERRSLPYWMVHPEKKLIWPACRYPSMAPLSPRKNLLLRRLPSH